MLEFAQAGERETLSLRLSARGAIVSQMVAVGQQAVRNMSILAGGTVAGFVVGWPGFVGKAIVVILMLSYHLRMRPAKIALKVIWRAIASVCGQLRVHRACGRELVRAELGCRQGYWGKTYYGRPQAVECSRQSSRLSRVTKRRARARR